MPVGQKKQAPECITLDRVKFAYGNRMILENISFRICKGEYVGIIGPNGGGKTTLLKLILGLLEPTSGSVLLFGKPVRQSRERYRIGYIPQRAAQIDLSFPATVEEIVQSGRTVKRGLFRSWSSMDARAVAHAMKVTDIEKLRHRRIGNLSGGERQRVMIARALAAEPDVLILDEPTVSIDAPSQEAFYDFVKGLHKSLGLTVMIVSHDIDIVSHQVERILCLNHHLTCHGPTHQVIKQGAIEELYSRHEPTAGHSHHI